MSKLNAAWHVENAKLVSAARATRGSNTSSGSGSAPRGANARGNGPGGVFGTNEPATSSLQLHLAKNPDNSGRPRDSRWLAYHRRQRWLTDCGRPQRRIHWDGPFNQNIYDPNTQQGSNMINYLRRGSTPFSACAYSLDLAADYQCVSTQQRQRRHLPAISMHVLSTRLSPGHPSEGAMLAEMDFHDGKGVMLSSIRAGAQRMGPGNWILTISQVNVPEGSSRNRRGLPSLE